MKLNDKNVTKFLYLTQGVGAVFVGFFLVAYLAGIPTTAVLHSEPAIRIPLTIFGAVLLVLLLIGCILAVLSKKD